MPVCVVIVQTTSQSSAPGSTWKLAKTGGACTFHVMRPLGSFSNDGPAKAPVQLVRLIGTLEGSVFTLKTPTIEGVFRNVSWSRMTGAFLRTSRRTEPAGAPDLKSSVPFLKSFGAAAIVAPKPMTIPPVPISFTRKSLAARVPFTVRA
jgi:hypothetical protein